MMWGLKLNRYFNRLEYGKQLFYGHNPGYFRYDKMKAMAGYLMCGEGYRQRDAAELLWQKIRYTCPSYEDRSVEKNINKAVKSVQMGGYHDIEPLKITQPEIDAIRRATSIKKQKLLFVMLCLVKYRNAVEKVDKDWVTFDYGSVVKLAGIHRSRKEINEMLCHLKRGGFLENSQLLTSNKKKITYRCEDGEPVMYIDDLRNLGVIWLDFVKDPCTRGKKLKRCQLCDAPFLDSSPTLNAKYCIDCSSGKRYEVCGRYCRQAVCGSCKRGY